MPKILLIDDDPGLLDILKEPLEDEGYEVLCALDGKKGLEIFSSTSIDVVMTDLNMPKKGGVDVIEQIRQQNKDVPIIVLTGDVIKDTIQLEVSKKIGANLSITKPVDPIKLVDQLKSLAANNPSREDGPFVVLLVEDEEDIREFLVEALEFSNLKVLEAKDGVEGLEKFRSEKPDIVLTDIYMPRMDGLTLIKNIRLENETVPILTISGASDDSLKTTKLIGANEAFSKPFNLEELVAALSSYKKD